MTDKTPPSINMINTGEGEDMWFTPKVLSRRRVKNIDQTLFVYGLYSPFHFSHYLYNGLMPLYSTIKEYKADEDSSNTLWTLRAKTYWNEHTPVDMSIWPNQQDIVLEEEDVLNSKQMLPHRLPMCFSKAVVGTGNRCSLWYCENDIPHNHYMSFREDVFKTPLDEENNACLKTTIHYGSGDSSKTKIAILNRKKSRHITNLHELVNAIVENIPDVTVSLIDFDGGCDLRSTAHLVEDADIFIAPFGNGLGAGLFMKKPKATIISIESRWYTESWFYWPMTSIGVRLYSFECTNSSCQEYDLNLVKSIDPNITYSDALQVMVKENPSVDYSIYGNYRKQVSRRVDIEQFIPYLKDKISRNDYDCHKDLCQPSMERNGNHVNY
ncbi:unnamed protein product [Cunninghamella blakesleeana]